MGQNWGKKKPVERNLKPTRETFLPEAKEIPLVDLSTKMYVNTSYQPTTVSDSHLEVGVKKRPAAVGVRSRDCQIL